MSTFLTATSELASIVTAEMMQFQELPLDDVDDDVITNLFGDFVPYEE